ncbi:MAG: branched-chain amino acid ABC transporter permease [Anaerolineae bacterium]|nr:branched-chain amino acid ABC transporter permease [Anaerolineae bacterium]
MTSQLDWNAGPWARANLKVTTLIVLAALVLPWLLFDSATGRFILHLLILFMAWCIVTQSWNLIMGVGGIFSFAQVALFAVGGLASGVVSQQFGISPFLTIWLGPIAATAAALVIGLPSLRLRGPYVVLLTLAFAELLRNFASQGPNWVAGGGYGLRYVPKFGFEEMWGTGLGRVAYYYVAFILFGVTTYLIWRIFHSPIGMSFRALRDSETYATSRGVDPFRFKLLLFAISAFFTGLAGGFLVHYNGAQSPAILNFSLTITLLAMVVLGGWGTFWGPILGTAMLTALPELLRGADNYRNMAIGASLALIAIFAPEGLFPLISQKVKKFLRDINNR